ncbi:MAG: guanylate kinase [Opitutales bacterium]|nr:guanylate kinase [Opitutales bacterium]
MPFRLSKGILFLLSGPAGTGKTTLCEGMLASSSNLKRIVTATTRTPRDNEVHGRDYYFFTEEEFKDHIDKGHFYEYAMVHGRLYGTLKEEVSRHTESGFDVILNIDVQGAASFRETFRTDPKMAQFLVSIFILPPSLDELRKRLKERAQDDENEITKRLETARKEMQLWKEYDYVIPTGSREHDFQLISSIYRAEKHRVRRV